MRRFIGLVISLLLLACGLATNSQAVSSVKAGARCVKVNQKVTVGRSVYQCRKSGKYLVWRLIATLPPPKPTPTPIRLPATGLPAARVLMAAGILGVVDRTTDSQSWAKYYGSGLGFKDAYVSSGSTFTLKWQVVDAGGFPLKDQAVSLYANKAWGESTATFKIGDLTVNPAGENDGANVPGTTDSNGQVSFLVTDLSAVAEPYGTAVDVKSSLPAGVAMFGQFALKVGNASQAQTSMDIVNVHVIRTQPKVPPSPQPECSRAAAYSRDSNYLWSQEFNEVAGTCPATSQWTSLLGDGFSQLGFYNYGTGEIESNLAKGAATDGKGHLIITTKKQGGVWTSSRIWTQGKANFQYGKIEIRMRLPEGTFNWPAFWMLGSNYQPTNRKFGTTVWPNSGEIDIVEGLNRNTVSQSTLHGNIFGTFSPWNGGAGVTLKAPLSDIAADFHTFAMLWKPNELAFTLDGAEYGRDTFDGTNITQTVNGQVTNVFNSNGVWPFNKPFFLILNNAVPPGTSGYSDGTTSTTVVDWIRYSTYDGYGTLNP